MQYPLVCLYFAEGESSTNSQSVCRSNLRFHINSVPPYKLFISFIFFTLFISKFHALVSTSSHSFTYLWQVSQLWVYSAGKSTGCWIASNWFAFPCKQLVFLTQAVNCPTMHQVCTSCILVYNTYIEFQLYLYSTNKSRSRTGNLSRYSDIVSPLSYSDNEGMNVILCILHSEWEWNSDMAWWMWKQYTMVETIISPVTGELL